MAFIACSCSRGDWPPTFELEYGQLAPTSQGALQHGMASPVLLAWHFEVIEGSILHINVRGLPNDERRDCDLATQSRHGFGGFEVIGHARVKSHQVMSRERCSQVIANNAAPSLGE